MDQFMTWMTERFAPRMNRLDHGRGPGVGAFLAGLQRV